MIQEGQIVIFKFPQTDQTIGKLRPALVIRKLPSFHDDWLICMISSQLSQEVPKFDEVIKEEDTDFLQSGLKTSSVIRITRLAVVNKNVLLGSIGNIGPERLASIKKNLSTWIIGT
ncbi:MAG: type II toxin-antitoxin system PemK/MazF family toxin [Thermodesulfovibrionales bacterium]|nr:type II toxin-antitoxin system PemK/MazF family toxin [Nitrospinota bacterium]MCG2708735.1 type II toxin-antitoxin system PemK/MazF family toxin [Thermodesulfovibrionales bacterium]